MLSILIVASLQEITNQQRNVVCAFDQCWHSNFDGAQAIEKIFTESARRHFRSKVAVGGSDDVHVHFLNFRRTNSLNFAILYHAQQLCLHLLRSFADLVQKNSAAIRIFKKAGARVEGSGKSTTNVTEKLALTTCPQVPSSCKRQSVPRPRD